MSGSIDLQTINLRLSALEEAVKALVAHIGAQEDLKVRLQQARSELIGNSA